MEREYEEAFSEVDEVLKLMPIDLLSKIPVQFRKVISENKDTNYKVNIKEPLEEQNLKKETIVILGLIYRDFLASPEEKEKLQIKDAEELKRIEQEMQEQYDIENIYKKRKKRNRLSNIEEDQESTDLILSEKPSFLKRFFNIIKGIFKKNKF
ncbi:MAG: hypothetical protein V8R51_08605 [Clostridia bacterium]